MGGITFAIYDQFNVRAKLHLLFRK